MINIDDKVEKKKKSSSIQTNFCQKPGIFLILKNIFVGQHRNP